MQLLGRLDVGDQPALHRAVHELELLGEGGQPLQGQVELDVAVGVLDVVDGVGEVARQAARLAQAQEGILGIERGDDRPRANLLAVTQPHAPDLAVLDQELLDLRLEAHLAAVLLEDLLEGRREGADAALRDLEVVGVAGGVVVRHGERAALGEGAHVRAVDGRGGERAEDGVVLARLLEELAHHLDGASVAELAQRPALLLVGRRRDDLLERRRRLVHVALEHVLEDGEVGAEAVERVQGVDAVVLGQVVGQVDGVRVADEGGVALVAEDREGALGRISSKPCWSSSRYLIISSRKISSAQAPTLCL